MTDPDALAAHRARNAALLADLAKRGLDMDEVRPIEHHFWAATHADAQTLAAELRAKGYFGVTIGSRKADAQGIFWSVEAAYERSLAEAGSETVTADLARLAASLNTDYDGWGVSL